MNKGFTLIEIVVVIGIVGILTSIISFSITQYINRGKDSNVSGNLSVLVPAGEAYYNINNTYNGFCESDSAVLKNAWTQMSFPSSNKDCDRGNFPGLCCYVDTNTGSYGNAWAACAQEFTNSKLAYCVDSRGVKKDICNSTCIGVPFYQCPDEVLPGCS